MKQETINSVVSLLEDFLENFDWNETKRFDLEFDIVEAVLLNEFSSSKLNHYNASFEEEEALLEVEWDVKRLISKIYCPSSWNEKTVGRFAINIIKVVKKSIKKNLVIEEENVFVETQT